jgi:hypothetical protein
MAFFRKIAALFHKIRIKLYPCRLPGKEGLYIGRNVRGTMLSIEDVCAALIKRGGFTGSYDVLVMCVTCFFDEVAYQLCDGFGISTGYFREIAETLDRKAHPVSFRFHILPLLRELTNLITIEASYAKTDGYIDTVTDFESQTVDNTLTPGGLFMAAGRCRLCPPRAIRRRLSRQLHTGYLRRFGRPNKQMHSICRADKM